MYIFRADKVSKKNQTVPLQCRLTINNVHNDVSTGIIVHISQWDKEKKCILQGCEGYVNLQEQVNSFETLIKAHFVTLCAAHQDVTTQMLKARYLDKPDTSGKTTTTKHTLLQSVDDLINDFEKKVYLPEDNQEKRSKETLKQWNSTRTKLIEYLSYRQTGVKPFISRKQQRSKEQQAQYIIDGKQYDLTLSEIKPVFAEEFYLYLTVDRTLKLKHAAANKQLKNTKQVFTYAVTKSRLQVNPLAYYRTADAETEVIPLEDNEVQAIINAKGLVPRIERIRDCYIAQIFTGFAFQDLKALTLENIYREPSTGVYFLCRERGKTGIDEMVPMLPEVKAIIDKYALDPECRANGVLFPVPSNSCYNQYLKELQVHCNIKTRKFDTHLGRHTFAHRMLNQFGFSLEIVSKMLGHKSIRTTQHYCKISLKRIAEAFAPHLVQERPKLTVIYSINRVYTQYGIAA